VSKEQPGIRSDVRYGSGFTDDPATYYDVLEPIGGATKPTMVLVHGGGHTGACFLATIDNRPGWAYDFVRHGHRVIVPGLAECRAQRLSRKRCASEVFAGRD
jgi:hypothetical protein